MKSSTAFKDKTLMITGGTGSFGNTVLKHFMNTDLAEIRIFSRDEKKQDDMRHRLQERSPELASKVRFFIGDVRNAQSVRDAMHGVDYIFHAAALKQVPSCEFFPMEAVRTNVIGTDNVLHAAIEEGVDRVVCLSTDKAAYPINAMGKSKAMMESIIYANARNGAGRTTICCNAYKAVSRKDHQFKDPEALRMINSLNAQVNTKIEKLAKGDRQYNNPAPGYKEGSLFEVEYLDGSRLSFRKHNSAVNNRYAIKPYYKKGSHDRLPAKPVLYLGLARLIPWGEYQDDGALKNSSFILPEDAQSELSDLYARITGIHASSFQAQSLRDIKKRQEFSTDIEGVDSNTVSSGEENVLILLTALLSLKRYYEALDESSQSETVCSLLLVDELDATLHPSFQYALLQLLIEYSTLFHIQIVFTTHSIFMLKQMFKEKQNVIYLYDGAGVVSKMDNPDIEKIEMYLTNRSRADLFSEKKIPVFTEDEEARCLIRLLISHLCKQADGFNHLNRHIHLIDGNLGGDIISSLFKDSQLRQSAIASFAILDGDKPSNLSKNTIALPGDGSSPEWLLFDYAIKLSTDGNNPFWAGECIQGEGFSISNFNQWIKPEIDEARNVVGGGQKREKAKAVFNRNILFFTYVFKAWMLDSANARDIRKFGFNLQAVYHKTANYHRIFIPSTVDFGIYTFKYE